MMNICINVILVCLAIVTLILTIGLLGVILIEIKDFIKENFFKREEFFLLSFFSKVLDNR